MAKISEVMDDLRALLEVDAPAFVWGKPGIGKSEIVFQIASELRRIEVAKLGNLSALELLEIAKIPLVIDIRLSTFDPVDLRGLPAIINGLTQWMRPQIWPVENRWNLTVILFFDEMDRAAPAVANAALQIVLDRRIGEHVLPASVRIVAAGNGASDKRTTQAIGEAQANRFTHLYADADAETASAHWNSIGVDPALVAFIRFRPQLIETTREQGKHAFASPRAWAKCAKFMHLPDARRHRLIAGTVGEAPAGECEAFIRMFRDLPSLDSIIRDPANAPVSDKINVQYAVSTGLARKATHANFAAVCTYAARMPREFEIMLVTDAVRRDRTLCETAAYAAWAVKNQDVTL